MTNDELRAKYNVAYKIIYRHRKFWAGAADSGLVAAEEKVKEMDRLLEVLKELKDELKARLESEPTQPRLLDAPQRAKYG